MSDSDSQIDKALGLDQEESPAWVYTERAMVGTSTDDGWPKERIEALINPKLDFVEVHSSIRHSGFVIRLSREAFQAWIKECQELLALDAEAVSARFRKEIG